MHAISNSVILIHNMVFEKILAKTEYTLAVG